ncbi:hypothetical protein [Marmoricola sp. RAF53]|uniref:hypothetical protein n=1 Tax=Marmoricola sp. RAF53 TaxID=3233059 RepID=UPI003F94E957
MIAEQTLFRHTTQTHRELDHLLGAASAMRKVPGQPRKGYEAADRFLDATSRHLSTVESVLLPAAAKHADDHGVLVHEYVHATKALEAALVVVKGREYGSAYAAKLRWDDVWGSVRTALHRQEDLETQLVNRLTEAIGEDKAAALVPRLDGASASAMSRPHPHAPHLGMPSIVARRFLHLVDSFWDTTEGRMVPEPEHAPHKKPGPMGQYLLGDPRFDDEED